MTNYIDVGLRADTLDTIHAALQHPMIDAVTTDEDGNIQPKPEALLDYFGHIVVTPAVLDGEGEVVTEAVLHPKYHVNMRVVATPERIALYEQLFAQMEAAQPDSSESAVLFAGVEIIDLTTVNTPRRVWA